MKAVRASLAELDRIRWHCRRGLLELDLVLEKFTSQHLAAMGPEELESFKELLAYSDVDLLDLVMARVASPDPRYDGILRLLRAV